MVGSEGSGWGAGEGCEGGPCWTTAAGGALTAAVLAEGAEAVPLARGCWNGTLEAERGVESGREGVAGMHCCGCSVYCCTACCQHTQEFCSENSNIKRRALEGRCLLRSCRPEKLHLNCEGQRICKRTIWRLVAPLLTTICWFTTVNMMSRRHHICISICASIKNQRQQVRTISARLSNLQPAHLSLDAQQVDDGCGSLPTGRDAQHRHQTPELCYAIESAAGVIQVHHIDSLPAPIGQDYQACLRDCCQVVERCLQVKWTS